jgi:hypothetical protein
MDRSFERKGDGAALFENLAAFSRQESIYFAD